MIDDVKFDKIELPFESNFDLSICHRQFSHFSHKMAPYNRYQWSDMGPLQMAEDKSGFHWVELWTDWYPYA